MKYEAANSDYGTESVINHFLPPLIESPQYSTSLLQVHVHPIIHVFYMCIY